VQEFRAKIISFMVSKPLYICTYFQYMQWIESKHFTQPTYFNSIYTVFNHIFEDINSKQHLIKSVNVHFGLQR